MAWNGQIDKGIAPKSQSHKTVCKMKKNFKRITWSVFMAVVLSLTACSSDDALSDMPPADTENKEDTGSTDTDTALAADSVELWSQRGDLKIYGVMYQPKSTTGKLPAIILSHSSSLTHAAMSGYALAIVQMGYAAYCFDFCGGSSQSRSDGSTDEMTIFTEVEDLRAVVDTLRTKPYVEASKLYLLGSSQGGLVSALLADERTDDFAGMILFYPAFNIPELINQLGSLGDWGSWGDWGDSGGFSGMGGMMSMSEAYINSVKDFDVWSHIGKFSKPVCIIHGTKDIIVPISNSEKAVGLYPNATLHAIEGANHGFNAANLGSIGSLMGASADYDSQVLPIIQQFLSGK